MSSSARNLRACLVFYSPVNAVVVVEFATISFTLKMSSWFQIINIGTRRNFIEMAASVEFQEYLYINLMAL